MSFTADDRKYMAEAVEEAAKDPRPFKVGAVIVTRDKTIIRAHGGEDEEGKEHAEHRAIDKTLAAGLSLDGATLYTTLEPCVEHARSPGDIPCAVKILETPIERVVYGIVDVDQRVRQHGRRKLSAGRVEVVLCNDREIITSIEKLMAPFLVRDRPKLLECPRVAPPLSFHGRYRERRDLTEWFCKLGANGRRPILLIHDGPGGTGKTALAYMWVKRDVVGDEIPLPADPKDVAARCRVSDGWRTGLTVVWYSFYREEGGGSFHGFLEEAIQHLSHGQHTVDEYERNEGVDYASMAQDVIKLVTQQPTLVVWDGAERLLKEYEDPAFSSGEERVAGETQELDSRLLADVHAARFLRQLAGDVHSRFLILSRVPFADLDDVPASAIKLEGLPPDAAVALLRDRGVKGSVGELRARAADYDYHPLALSNLAAAVTSDFAASGDIRDAPSFDAGIPMHRRRKHVLAVAYNKRAAPLRHLLSRMAAIDGEIQQDAIKVLARGIASLDDLGPSLRELTRHGLIGETPQEEETTYRIHPIVRTYAYSRLLKKETVHAALAEYYKIRPLVRGRGPVPAEWMHRVTQYYRHTARAARFEEAYSILYYSEVAAAKHQFGNRDLNHVQFYELGAYRDYVACLTELFPRGTNGWPAVDKLLQPFVLLNLALGVSLTGNPLAARRLLKKAIDRANSIVRGARIDSPEWFAGTRARAQCLESLGAVQFSTGDLRRASNTLQASVEAYSRVARGADRLVSRSREHLVRGEIHESRVALHEALIARDQFENEKRFPLRELLKMQIRCGASFTASDLRETVELSVGSVGPADPFFGLIMAEAALSKEDVEAASDHVGQSEQAYTSQPVSSRFRRVSIDLAFMKAEIACTKADWATAESLFNKAVKEASLSRNLEYEAKSMLGYARARFRRAIGAPRNNATSAILDDAEATAMESLAIGQRCGYGLVTADAHLLLAKIAGHRGDTVNRFLHANKAKAYSAVGYRRPTERSRIYWPTYKEAVRLLKDEWVAAH